VKNCQAERLLRLRLLPPHRSLQHVSDLKFWNNAVARQYGIMAVPANLLIDPTGRIVAKDLHDGQLETTLSTLIK